MSTAASHHAHVVLFDVYVLLGVILFTGTLLPAIFSRGVQRTIGWYSLMTAWLVYSLSYGLIVGYQEGPEPPFALCVTQTLLIYAVPALAGIGTLCYYIEFYLTISGLKSGNIRQPCSVRTFWLVATPWLVFLAIIVEVLVLIFPGGRLHLVERADNNFYCHLGDPLPNNVTGFVITCGMGILVPLEVWTGALMYRNWDVFKRLSRTDRRIFLTVYLRLILCTLAALIGFVVSTLAVVFPAPSVTSLVYPGLSIFIGVAFGTQKDLLRAWLFWRPPKPYGAIVFNNGTVVTTNVYTCGGGDAGGSDQMQPQQQETHKNVFADSDSTKRGRPTSFVSLTSLTGLKSEPGLDSEAPSATMVHVDLWSRSSQQRSGGSDPPLPPLAGRMSQQISGEPPGNGRWITPPV